MLASKFLVQLLGMWGSTDFLSGEIGLNYILPIIPNKEVHGESYFNSQQCLKSPPSQSLGTLHQVHMHLLIISTCKHPLQMSSITRYLLSMIQKKTASLPNWSWNHHFLEGERCLCKNSKSRNGRSPWKKSQAQLSGRALQGNASCQGAIAATMLIWAGFPPQVRLLLHDGFPSFR